MAGIVRGKAGNWPLFPIWARSGAEGGEIADDTYGDRVRFGAIVKIGTEKLKGVSAVCITGCQNGLFFSPTQGT